MDVTLFEHKLLKIRTGLAARQALLQPLPDMGAVATFPLAFWDGVNASADLLMCSFEPGSVLHVGVHELVRTGRVGGFDVTASTWVTVGEHPELPEPFGALVWRPDLNRRPHPDPADPPEQNPWVDELVDHIALQPMSRNLLRRTLKRLVSEGERAHAELLEQFAPAVSKAISNRRAVIDRNPSFDPDDARAILQAELSDVLLRFASADRPSATILRTLRFALPNRLDAALGTVDRAHSGSAEKAEIQLFVRNHHELTPMPQKCRAKGPELDRLCEVISGRLNISDRNHLVTQIRKAEDVQWSISLSRAQRQAASRGEKLKRGWTPDKHRFSVPHICEALAHQVTLMSLDAPTNDGEGDLHSLISHAPEQGFSSVESRDLVRELLEPFEDHTLEALVHVLRSQGLTWDQVAEQAGLLEPETARKNAPRKLKEALVDQSTSVRRWADKIKAGRDLTELERQVFFWRSGMAGYPLPWEEICSRTGLSQRYRSKTAAETRARAVLRRAESLVRGRAALALEVPASNRAEMVHARAEALASAPFALEVPTEPR